jgi:hypothetical protein
VSWRLDTRSLACLVLVSVVSPACYSTGAKAIRAGRGNYNIAIQQTNAQQLLLNLVRLRYRDTPAFLLVSSVSTSFTLAVDAEAGVADLDDLGVVGLSGGLYYAEKPTVTYSPLQGQQFVDMLMSPVSLRVPLVLYHSGWRIDRVLKICLQNIGNLRNAPGGASPTPSLAPEYEQFARAASVLRALQYRGLIELGQNERDEDAIVLQIDSQAVDLPEVQELTRALGVPDNTSRITLTTGARLGPGTVPVMTRSVMGSMFFLSLGVEPPLEDERAGRVTVTLDEEGRRFDWSDVTRDLISIRSSDSRPENVYTGISYRGSWFYIDDGDLESKSSFSLLAQLFALQAGDIELTGPVLTLPVR